MTAALRPHGPEGSVIGPDMERSATLSDRFTSVPDGWDKATSDQVQYAMDQVWTALNHEDVVTRVERYYRKDGNFAGATFLGLDPVDPYRFDGRPPVAQPAQRGCATGRNPHRCSSRPANGATSCVC